MTTWRNAFDRSDDDVAFLEANTEGVPIQQSVICHGSIIRFYGQSCLSPHHLVDHAGVALDDLHDLI